jgi:hypothetical protein
VRHRRTTLTLVVGALALASHVPSAAAETAVVSMNGPADIEEVGDNVTGVTTGADTTVLLQVDAAHDLTVYQHTQLVVGDSLGLRTGTLRARGTLTIVTTNAVVRLTDGELTVAYDARSGTTTVEVTDDDAEVRGTNDEPVAVPSGQTVRVGADGVTTDPAPISVDDVSAARRASAAGRDSSNLPQLVVAFASACVLVGLVASRRARRLLFAR